MAMYMKGGEEFVFSELDEVAPGSEGNDGTGKSSTNTFCSLSG